MIDTIMGLHHMHHGDRHSMMHRDLKPKNLLVFRRNGAGPGAGGGGADTHAHTDPFVNVKLGDLGLARELEDTLRSRAQSGVGTGTLLTMAPEVTGGDYSPAGDVFSWGVTMCMVVCQALPRPPRPLGATRGAITGPALGLLRRESSIVAGVIEQCMELHETQRPCSAEVRDRLLQAAGVWPELGTQWRPQGQHITSLGMFLFAASGSPHNL
jgi:serine/threonine protein kinase